ncbi:hypothetical protein [Nocardia heshunensis]
MAAEFGLNTCDILFGSNTTGRLSVIDYFEIGSMWPEKDSCASLSTIVEASAHLIHTRPLRENSPYPGMKTKLGHVDPAEYWTAC